MRFLQQTLKSLVAIFAISLPGMVAAAAPAGPCAPLNRDGVAFVVCSFNPGKSDIRLFWRDDEGQSFAGFDRLADAVAGKGGSLVFAMNAGMYQPDLSPVGLYVERGQELRPVNRRGGQGNFNLRPNGVFWVRQGAAGVTETQKFVAQNLRPDYATQSGPMLVIGGRIHPKIHPDGTSAKIRNGVGVCEDGMVRFVIADDPVTFYNFASLFVDMKCPDALYLDGSVSALYAPSLKRNDGWKSIGPIVGVVEGLKK
ncbi:MAG: phosphodiester glycosidase family protein [Hyphomicrobiales bacterium]|nr:phosphodiester glycosidase family protein [Hyphomicrobiales bacterium]